MAVITPGANSSIAARTVEGQMIEIINYLKIQELNTTINTTNAQNVQSSFNANGLVFNGTFSLPISQVLDSNGFITLQALNYIPAATFSAGSNGTFTSNNPAQYLLEILIYMQNFEKDTTHNPQQKNCVSSSFDTDTAIYSGTVNLPIATSIDANGNIVFTATEYLAT